MSKASSYASMTLPAGSRVVLVVSQGPSGTAPQSFVAMPDILGKSQGAALEAVSRAQLQTQVVYDYNDLARKGSVMAQRPIGGSSVPAGSEALVLVSSGAALNERPLIGLPDVIGMVETQAVGVLTAAGLSPQVMYEASPNVEAGVVIDQVPNHSTYDSAEPKSKVATWLLIALLAVLLITGGVFMFGKTKPEPKMVTVPVVVGMQQADAEKELLRVGLSVGNISEQSAPSASTVPGSVLSSNPNAGLEISPNSPVDLVVAKEQTTTLIEMPDVVGSAQDSAQQTITSLGFSVTVTTLADDSAAIGTVISQAPTGGVMKTPGAHVSLVVSSGPASETPPTTDPAASKVSVPDVAGLSESAAKTTLGGVGFKISVTKSPSADVAKGLVIVQSPTAGSIVEKGTRVVIVVSTGLPKDETVIAVPNLVGKTVGDATLALEALGLQVSISPEGAVGAVASQVPAASSSVPQGSVVLLNVK